MTRRGRASRVRAIVAFAATAALLTATLHLASRGVRLLVLHEFQPIGPDAIWMAPLAELGFFLALAAPFVIAALVQPLPVIERVALFVFGAMAITLGGLQSRALHPAAAVLLGLGVGWRLAVSLRAAPRRVRQSIRLVLATLAGVFAVATVVELVRMEDGGPLAGTAAPAGAPNVLILILDTVGARHLSLYGYNRETSPHLDSLASEATVFDDAIAPSSWTLPSHASMFTGVVPWDLSARWTVPLDASAPTLAERFAVRGYRTAGFVGNLVYAGPATGLARGFQYYRADRRTLKALALRATITQTPLFEAVRSGSIAQRLRALVLPSLRIGWEPRKDPKRAGTVVDEFLHWQAGVRDRPFFAFLNFFDAHYPYQPPAPFDTRFASQPKGRDRHDGAIAYEDVMIQHLVDVLRARGVLDKTILVIAGDHGNAFGEHGLHGHGNSLFRELVHVPLLLRYPARVPSGIRIHGVASLTDLAATLLSLADPTEPVPMPGNPLTPMWADSVPVPRIAISWVERSDNPNEPTSQGDLASATSDSQQLIIAQDGSVGLYEYIDDPEEQVNVLTERGAQAVPAALRDTLAPITRRWHKGGP